VRFTFVCECRQQVRFVAVWNGAESLDCNYDYELLECLSPVKDVILNKGIAFASTKEEMDSQCR
jgi:hypothetical protein